MDESFHIDGPALEGLRRYLYFLACTHIDSWLRGKIEPSDLVQQTLLKAVTNRDQFRGNGDAELAGWLRQMLINNLRDEIRFLRREKRDVARLVSLEASITESFSRLDSLLAASVASPIEQAANYEQLMRLPDALDRLPESQRDSIVKHHLQGLSLAETAERLGRTESSVAGLLHRGLKKLRKLLEGEGN
jgi:RNA polymerase sigma-70 factor (ECF subfamily)